MRQFTCFLCNKVFDTESEPIMHYDDDEMDSEGEVSLCDDCTEQAQKDAEKHPLKDRLSRRFFDPKIPTA